VLLLVSADFIASYYCYEHEMTVALRRHMQGEARVLPVIVKPVDFANMPFAKLQVVPRNAKPVSTWRDSESAWMDVAQGIRGIVVALIESHALSRNSTLIDRIGHTESHDERADFVPGGLEQRLRKYYGGKLCVVDGDSLDETEVDWFPLEGDMVNASFKNLVPLGRRHRLRPTGANASRRQSEGGFRFSIDLTAENLLHKARAHFHAGRPALAYGCARLGETLAHRYADKFEAMEDDGWAFLCQCLFYLPYRMQVDLLEATLFRVRLWLATAPACPASRRATLLLSIANLYQDIGDWAQAESIYERVLYGGLLRPTEALSRPTEAATLRRIAIGRFSQGVSETSLSNDFAKIADIGLTTDFLLSLAIARGWWYIAREEPGQCLALLEPFDFDADTLSIATDYSPHNAFELKLTQVAALKALELNYSPQIQLVTRLAQAIKYTGLRSVFTEHIAPTVIPYEARMLIKPLASPMIATPALIESINNTAKFLLETNCTEISGRPIWVD